MDWLPGARFQALWTERLEHPQESSPFMETYFSNYIEGAEFLVDEAVDIIFEGWSREGWRPGSAAKAA